MIDSYDFWYGFDGARIASDSGNKRGASFAWSQHLAHELVSSVADSCMHFLEMVAIATSASCPGEGKGREGRRVTPRYRYVPV